MEELISRGIIAATNMAVQTLAIKQGMVTLLQDGVLKVVAGDTSLDEVYKAVGQ
jgi:type II secretory ATPase GspE/PulE/Tfp pilus assembly ATPase PilB-like protein